MLDRKAIDSQAVSLMLLLSMVWGMQQVALKIAAPDMAPLLQIVFRSAIAAILVGAIIFFRPHKMQVSGVWIPGLIAGLFFSLEYFFVGASLHYTSASHVTVFLYSAPIFVALALHFVDNNEKLSPIQWLGIGLAFSGIACTFLLRDNSTSAQAAQILWGDFLALLAGASWGAVTVCVRSTKLSSIPAAQTLFYQLAVATVVLGISAVVTNQISFTMTAIVATSLLYQGVIVCSLSFLTWYWLLRQYPASQLGVFSFVTPLFGIIFGVWLLDESLESNFIGGASLVLVGIALVTLRRETIRNLRAKFKRDS
ncbi:MAG: drug/metabolite transporter (DMT)-like permease [Oceanospirillaceae bacterium]|jgi:drug/metabolite transporter (DMT)-like permease